MIDVAGLGLADDGVDQKICLGDLGGALGQFLVRAVHRIARLERHHALPAPALEFGAQVLRVVAQLGEVILHRAGDADEGPAEVDGVRLVEQIVDAGVGLVGGAEHRLRLTATIGLPDRLHGHGGDQEALRVA